MKLPPWKSRRMGSLSVLMSMPDEVVTMEEAVDIAERAETWVAVRPSFVAEDEADLGVVGVGVDLGGM